MMYFKVTNEKECHHGYQYQTGLNILDKPFEKEGSCVEGGLYFTDLENLDKFYYYGVWLRVVIIPEDAIMVKDPSGGKWRADRIILGDKYPLFDVETIKKFNLKMTEDYVDCASENGCVDVLEWWLKVHKSCGLELKYTDDAMYYASGNGHVDVLEWWLKVHNEYGLELKYTDWAMDAASFDGRVNVLEWWLKAHNESGLELKYIVAINWTSQNGHVDVLEWWKSSGLPLKYTSDAIDCASEYGHVNVLEWWLKAHNEFGLELKYSSHGINWASSMGYISVLNWWKSCGLKLKYDSWATECRCDGVISWWKSSGLPLK